jgi:hypothetical protein
MDRVKSPEQQLLRQRDVARRGQQSVSGAETFQLPAHDWHTRIIDAWRKSTDAIFRTGDLLIEAKAELGHGEFINMVRTQLPFRERTAQRLMQISADQRLRNASGQTHLPPEIPILYGLTRLCNTAFDQAIAAGPNELRSFLRATLRQKIKPEGGGHIPLPRSASRSANLAAVDNLEPTHVGTLPSSDTLAWLDLLLTLDIDEVVELLLGERSQECAIVQERLETILQALRANSKGCGGHAA